MDTAINTAGQLLLDGQDIVVWDGDREVIRLAANLAEADVFEGAVGRNSKLLSMSSRASLTGTQWSAVGHRRSMFRVE
jgi:hypothetical protein